jgi:hypothetical protein
MPLWIRFEDLASAAVGPFDTQEQVDRHIEICKLRGDAAAVYHTPQILTEEPTDVGITMTPEEDLRWWDDAKGDSVKTDLQLREGETVEEFCQRVWDAGYRPVFGDFTVQTMRSVGAEDLDYEDDANAEDDILESMGRPRLRS